jgi:hypothetical protein
MTTKITENNYISYKPYIDVIFTNESFWYTRPEEKDISQLGEETINNFKEGGSLLPIFKSILADQLKPRGPIESAYVSYEADGLKVTYPSLYQSFYEIYDGKEVICPRIFTDPPHIMKDYDPRWREFYIDAMDNNPEDLFFGPYSSAGSAEGEAFFAGTISKAYMKDEKLKSIISIDLGLNYEDNFVEISGIDSKFSYSFVSSLDGKPLFHSRFKIEDAESISFTKLEFSDTSSPLSEEPDTDEARYFNETILPSIISATKTETLHYKSL